VPPCFRCLHRGVSGLPGALIFLAPLPLYLFIHSAGVAEWGTTLMQDQQLAAVIMWIPAGLIYVAVWEWVFLQWLREAERRAGVAVLKTLPTVKLS
jgi:putative membrane protein